MEATFYQQNRQELLTKLEPGSSALIFAGSPVHKTNDEVYPFFANRNFLYLTGISQAESILMINDGETILYVLPSDLLAERWNGKRLSVAAAQSISGITDIRSTEIFQRDLAALLAKGGKRMYLDFDQTVIVKDNDPAFKCSQELRQAYPYLQFENLNPFLRELRTIKKPAEIAALRQAEVITKQGIEAMMAHARAGMKEYQLKAVYDYTLAQAGVLQPAWDEIVSSGANNFCIHYNSGFDGTLADGEMILNDVGASYDHLVTDVSRPFPVNGKFDPRQKQLYSVAYEVSEEMFQLIKPGMPIKAVDATIREKVTERLLEAGILDKPEDITRYMWHGGAHHIGFNVHDAVQAEVILQPGMVFCVDIGIYHEEWGIGFRLEDNCLVTADGCENLSQDIPRKIEEIEALVGSAYR